MNKKELIEYALLNLLGQDYTLFKSEQDTVENILDCIQYVNLNRNFFKES